MKNENWRRFIVTNESFFYPIFSKVIKEVPIGQNSVVISVINKAKSEALKQEYKDIFRFDLDWQDENTVCGIEVYKKIGE